LGDKQTLSEFPQPESPKSMANERGQLHATRKEHFEISDLVRSQYFDKVILSLQHFEFDEALIVYSTKQLNVKSLTRNAYNGSGGKKPWGNFFREAFSALSR
jgi:hypothetical protein